MTTIPGLQYIPRFLDVAHERQLVDTIDEQPWLRDLKRRVQHYGYRYNYRARAVDPSMFLGPLPPWAAAVADDLYRRKLFPCVPDFRTTIIFHTRRQLKFT